jgi:hypothetical protein
MTKAWEKKFTNVKRRLKGFGATNVSDKKERQIKI